MKHLRPFILLCIAILVVSCKNETKVNADQQENDIVEYANSFSIFEYEGYSLLEVKQPWAGADKSFYYVLYTNDQSIDPAFVDYPRIKVPVSNVVLTSTTHIPAIEVLNETKSLIGFPGLDYVSTPQVRKHIEDGKVKELGQNEALDTELLIDLSPDVLIAFAMDGTNNALNQLQKSGIPVLYNGDWTEQNPLGKAEWIKLFGALYGKEQLADAFFKEVVQNYNDVLHQITDVAHTPSVLSGAMYQDVWYLPQGGSWAAVYFNDAKANYLWKDTKGVGSLPLSFEEVLDKGKNADYWINPAQYETLDEMVMVNPHYAEFESYKNKNVYTFATTKGTTGGTLFYELGPLRPDLVLKDLVSILHPNVFPDYTPTFYKQLQ